MIPAVALT